MVLYGEFDAVASSFTNWTQKTFDAQNWKLKCLSAFEAASNGKIDAKMAPNSLPLCCCAKKLQPVEMKQNQQTGRAASVKTGAPWNINNGDLVRLFSFANG